MIVSEELFKKSLSKLFRAGMPSKVAVALSGGPDSMLLTWLLQNQKRQMKNLDIYAITIDHKYRSGSHEEAKKVHQWIKDWDVLHIIKSLEYKDNIDPKKLTNFEEVAREERYRVMSQICFKESIPVLFMGHHRDDQLETFIQRLQGNSSIFGLAGTRSVSPVPTSKDLSPNETQDKLQIQIARPFLEFDKKDILETCNANGIHYVTDLTNGDVGLTRRNYLRYLIGEVIPHKSGNHQGDISASETTARNDPYSLIQKTELIKLHASCHDFASLFENKAQKLSAYLQKNDLVKEYPQLGKLEVTLPRDCLQGINCVVTSRYLYRILHPYSTSKHYHWVYAKLERQLIPRIANFLEKHKLGMLKMTIMNLVFEIKNNSHSDMIPIKIYRCPIVKRESSSLEKRLVVTNKWSEWELFDSRFWIRIRSKLLHYKIRIVPYFHKVHKPMIEEKLFAKFQPSQDHDTLPVFLDELTQKIIVFPTLSMISPKYDLDYQWAQKKNRFTYFE